MYTHADVNRKVMSYHTDMFILDSMNLKIPYFDHKKKISGGGGITDASHHKSHSCVARVSRAVAYNSSTNTQLISAGSDAKPGDSHMSVSHLCRSHADPWWLHYVASIAYSTDLKIPGHQDHAIPSGPDTSTLLSMCSAHTNNICKIHSISICIWLGQWIHMRIIDHSTTARLWPHTCERTQLYT